MPRPRIGVILSGCGVNDGSEIHEAVATLLELARCGARAVCLAPDTPQLHVVNHVDGMISPETRNVLTESARIARGNIVNIMKARVVDLDGVILPGGFGAAKNLCSFATAGADCEVHPEIERLLTEMHSEGKPIGAICIAPVIVARVLGNRGIRVELTVGDDPETAEKIRAMGAAHVDRKVREIAIDSVNRVVSTPAYMLANSIDEAADGIAALVREVVRLATL
jgi:enhancing lycopene biosynthesis protein 2